MSCSRSVHAHPQSRFCARAIDERCFRCVCKSSLEVPQSMSSRSILVGMKMLFVVNYMLVALTVQLGHSSGEYGESFPSDAQLTRSSQYQCSRNKEWFCFNSTTVAYNCSQIHSILPDQIKCFESGPALSFGYCATYDENTRILSLLPSCGYFQYGVYNVTTPGYIQLPTVLTELNDYMCSPLHRKGIVCSECADGFGPSLTSYWHRCANCTDVWYGVPLALLIQLIPVTFLYFVVVAFQIRLTAPPMPYFIMFAQLCHIVFDAAHPVGQSVPIYETKDGHIRLLDYNIAYLLYSMFNLDFFLNILPPFCVSSKLKFYHVMLFGYFSAFYPMFLIFLTWLCVELHDHNYRLLQCLWKPFQVCQARLKKQGVDTKSDLVDVFATFFLLSYHKCLYQTQMYYGTGLAFIFNIDPTGNSFSIYKGSVDGSYTITYIVFLISTLCISAFFCLLPPILLICYPFRFFRLCLSRCHLDTIAVNTFVENFHGYYRNGLDGGRDMRSLSGFYFFFVIVICLAPLFSALIIKDYYFRTSKIIVLVVAFAIALIRPYKKTYANVLDTLILANICLLSFLSHTITNIGSIPLRILLLAPLAIFIVALLFKMFHKVFQICNIKGSPCCKFLCRCTFGRTSHEELSESSALIATTTTRQPMISPTVSLLRNSYGTLPNN